MATSRRADLGAPIDPWFEKQPPELRAIVDELRGLIEKAGPKAKASIKWGMPFWELNGGMYTAIGAHKKHVNLLLPGDYDDPDGLLEGEGKTGKHLKLRPGEKLPRAAIQRFLKVAAKRAGEPGRR